MFSEVFPNFIDITNDVNARNGINFNAVNGNDMILEEQIEQQTGEFFAILDQLDPFKHNEYLAILSANNQYVPDDIEEVK